VSIYAACKLSFKLCFLETDKCNLPHENVLNKEFDFLLSRYCHDIIPMTKNVDNRSTHKVLKIFKKTTCTFVYKCARLHFGSWSSWSHISETFFPTCIGALEGKWYSLRDCSVENMVHFHGLCILRGIVVVVNLKNIKYYDVNCVYACLYGFAQQGGVNIVGGGEFNIPIFNPRPSDV
jgi:hypothetical protein